MRVEMMNKLVLILAMTMVSISCERNGNLEGNQAGTFYQTLITDTDNQEREFIVYVPQKAEGIEEVPVLFVIHGTNQSGQLFYDNPELWTPKADEEGFIVVYPTGLKHCHFDNGVERTVTKWASGELGETDVSQGGLSLCIGQALADDMRFFDQMVAAIKEKYVVDSKRFYVTGFSNGANMAARLAAQRSDIFAAVTVHAGYLSSFIPSTLSTSPMSMIVSVGANDDLFATAAGLTIPIPVDSNLMNNAGVVNLVQPFLDISGLDRSYRYSEFQFSNSKVANFYFENSTIGLNNSLRFILIENLAHNYTGVLIDDFWSFLETQSL